LKLLENNQNCNIVITDGRFPDEIKYVKWMGGTVIKIERPSLKNNEYSNHTSENQIDKLLYDYLIVNDGTKEDMWNKLIIILNTS
jgi:hypothetical protein